jgi:hypothetical protein
MGTVTSTRRSGTGRPVRILMVCAAGLACWIVYLGLTLNQDQYGVRRWGLAWIGLDIGEVAGLVVTALLLRRRSPSAALVAAATSTLFFVDAWFDTVTSNQGLDYGIALLLALFAEWPLAVYCAVLAVRTTRWYSGRGR